MTTFYGNQDTWFVVAVEGRDFNYAPEVEQFDNRPDALHWLERCKSKRYQWGKCYARRGSDGRYIFEAEFQQRAAN